MTYLRLGAAVLTIGLLIPSAPAKSDGIGSGEQQGQDVVRRWSEAFPICAGKDVPSGEFAECCIGQLYALKEPLKIRIDAAATAEEREPLLALYTNLVGWLAEYERTKAKLEAELRERQRKQERAEAEAFARRRQAQAEEAMRRQQAEAEAAMQRQAVLQWWLQRR